MTRHRIGYTVLTAVDGETALKLYREQKGQIDLVILDLIMPGMSGTSVLDALLKLDPATKVIVASGYSDIGPMRESREAGAKSFIAKPYEIKQLLQMIREVMDRE
jgi:CheY-like chemotaxis protein